MGFTGFVIWFIVALMSCMFLQILFSNEFIVSFIMALMMGVVGAIEK